MYVGGLLFSALMSLDLWFIFSRKETIYFSVVRLVSCSESRSPSEAFTKKRIVTIKPASAVQFLHLIR